WVTLGTLRASPSGSVGEFVVPGKMVENPDSKVEVRIGSGETLPVLAVPDLKAARLEALKECRLQAQSSIFSGETFPELNFLEPGLVQAAFGDVSVSVRYFNAQYQEVTTAATSGRYGALVTLTTPDGLVDVREVTMFRSLKP